ncbi:MAG TPA: transcription-repair coupling factor, partial [Bacteroidales bacterium]|nr:transcription-repair coupling factor [Bacteroidales bacterium]
LDSIEDEQSLVAFADRLADRFGPLPAATSDLVDSIRMRWLAREAGMEKLVLKGGKMTGFFIQDEASPYFQTDRFTAVLRFVQARPAECYMKENNGRLTLTFRKTASVSEAIALLSQLQPAAS